MTDSFPISANAGECCFNPLVCSTPQGHIVVWGCGGDTSNALYARIVTKNASYDPVKIGSITNTDHLLFLRNYEKAYILAVEGSTGTTVYFLDDNASVMSTHNYRNSDVLVHCCPELGTDNTILFTFSYKHHNLYITSVPNSDWNENGTVHSTFKNVWDLPQVFTNGSRFTAGWLNGKHELQVINSNITEKQGQVTTLSPYEIDYIMSTTVDNDTVVYGGYNNATSELRLDFFSTIDGKHMCSRFWKSKEYKGLCFTMEPLNNGFMLLGEGENETTIFGQRFTHLGSWLYPLRDLFESEEPSWSPALSRGDRTLLVYVKEFKAFSEVWGTWLNVGEIPELNDLSLSDRGIVHKRRAVS